MKSINFGQSLQIVANLGVIAGILFLGVELRQNNELLAAQSRAVRINIRTEFSQAQYANPELTQALVKARTGGPLTTEDLFRIQWFASETLDKFSYVFGEFKRGMIDEDDMAVAAWRKTFIQDVPGMVELWERQRAIYDPEFVDYIDNTVLTPQ